MRRLIFSAPFDFARTSCFARSGRGRAGVRSRLPFGEQLAQARGLNELRLVVLSFNPCEEVISSFLSASQIVGWMRAGALRWSRLPVRYTAQCRVRFPGAPAGDGSTLVAECRGDVLWSACIGPARHIETREASQ